MQPSSKRRWIVMLAISTTMTLASLVAWMYHDQMADHLGQGQREEFLRLMPLLGQRKAEAAYFDNKNKDDLAVKKEYQVFLDKYDEVLIRADEFDRRLTRYDYYRGNKIFAFKVSFFMILLTFAIICFMVCESGDELVEDNKNNGNNLSPS